MASGVFAIVDFVFGMGTAGLLLYLLYDDSIVVHYDNFLRTIAVGMIVFAVTGLITNSTAPSLLHAVHGVATLAVAIGLYGMLKSMITPQKYFSSASTTEMADFEAAFGMENDE